MVESLRNHSTLITDRRPTKPVGKSLLAECTIAIMEAMCATSPALSARQNLFFKKMSFADFEDIKEAEREDHPQNQLVIFNRLLSAGVPKDALEARYFKVSPKYPIYLNPQQPKFILPSAALDQFSNPDERQRFRAIRGFGKVFIYNLLKALPYLDNPYYDGRIKFMEARWRAMFMDDFREYWEELEQQYKNKETKRGFNEGEKKLIRLFTTNHPVRKPRFIPVGAMIAMVLPDQTLSTSEYFLGRNFNEGVVGHIAALVEQRYLKLVKERGLLPQSKENPPAPPKMQRASERILRVVGLGNDQDLIEEYLSSGIALRCIQTEDNSRVNIWCYPPEFVNSFSILACST